MRKTEYRVSDPFYHRALSWRSSVPRRAKKKGVQVDMKIFTVDNLVNLQKNQPKCKCCHKLFEFEFLKNNKNLSPSLDRVLPGEGYTIKNTAMICYVCNMVKNCGSAVEHENVAKYMRKHETALNKRQRRRE